MRGIYHFYERVLTLYYHGAYPLEGCCIRRLRIEYEAYRSNAQKQDDERHRKEDAVSLLRHFRRTLGELTRNWHPLVQAHIRERAVYVLRGISFRDETLLDFFYAFSRRELSRDEIKKGLISHGIYIGYHARTEYRELPTVTKSGFYGIIEG
jgi:hypothetical protein